MPLMDLGEVRMNYEVHGEGDPVVLITGLGGDVSFWKGLVPLLERRCRMIVLDNRGAGRTEYPRRRFTIADMADDIVGLLDGLGLERAHVVGWSMGGNIAQEMAMAHPRRVCSLTLISTYTRRPSRSSYAIDAMIRTVKEGANIACFLRLMQSYCLTEEAFRRKESNGRNGDPEDQGCCIEGIALQKEALDAFDSKGRVEGISSPTLVIHGGEDIMVPPCMGERLADAIPDSVFRVIDGQGHIIHPTGYVEYLVAHMSRHNAL